MIKKRAGWLSVLLISEMFTTTAMQHFDVELQKVEMLALFVPLVMSSGGNSGSQATSLVTRAMALREIELTDWWRVALRELPSGLSARRDPRRHRRHSDHALAVPHGALSVVADRVQLRCALGAHRAHGRALARSAS